MNNLIISLSGIRGIVGETLTDKEAYIAAGLFCRIYLKTQTKPFKIIIGRDIKPTGDKLLKGAASALYDNGVQDVVNLGITTLPIMQWAVGHFKASGGILITASHNPVQWNGIKFISSIKDGATILPASFMRQIKEQWKESETKLSELPSEKSLTAEYNKNVIDDIKKIIDLCSGNAGKGDEILSKIKEKQFRIALDACSEEGAQIPKSFLLALGIEDNNIYTINEGSVSECKRRLEPSPDYLSELKETTEKNNLDIGFAFDPDQDRLAVVPLYSEELVPILCGKFLLKLQKDAKTKYINKIAINLSTSSLWEHVAKEHGVEIIRTRVGEFNVVEAMNQYNLPFGAEGNGGIILKSITAGRNSTVAVALILAYMAWSNGSIKKLEEELPRYSMIKDKIAVSISQEKIQEFLKNKITAFTSANKDKIKNIDIQDGYRIVFKDNSWAHIRPSNTEPIIRLISESSQESITQSVVMQLKNLFKD